jgi:beta-lactamase regulating signal transducer with metallopeptidase domain
MNPLAVAPWGLVLAGWSVLIALWHTSVVALAFATWRLWQHAAPARTQYAAAASVLGLAAVLTLATPAMLLMGGRTALPVATRLAPASPAISGASAPAASTPAAMSDRLRAEVRRVASVAAPWIGAAWCLGFAIGVIRLCGGWGVAQWIRRRATAVSSVELADAARDAAVAWNLPAAPVLASAHVEAPVVIGARAPAVLLPLDLEQRLDADALRPLLAHELAHVDRRDYAANLLQSLADTLLFFSPGARWLSRSVRESREYCCDDLVAARCGVGAYASALATLAGLGVAARARPAVNAAGPRLIVRIRRLLREDTMTPFAGFRLAGLMVASALVATAGVGVMPLSAAAMAGMRSEASPGRVVSRGVQGDIPMGFLHTQPGAAMRLRAMQPTDAGICGTAEIENLANVAVTGVRFIVYAHASGAALFGERSNLGVASVGTSDLLSIDLAPQHVATLDVNLLTATQARQMLNTPYAQIMCGLAEVRYANGGRWEAPPATIYGPERAEIPRALIGQASSENGFCQDDRGGGYSEGAVVPVRLEPLHFARCEGGQWNDYELTALSAGKPFVWLDFVMPSGHRPALGVEPGTMARLNTNAGSWGFTPTVDPTDERRVRLEVHDLRASPAVRVADLSLSVGGAPARIPGAGVTVQIRATRNP